MTDQRLSTTDGVSPGCDALLCFWISKLDIRETRIGAEDCHAIQDLIVSQKKFLNMLGNFATVQVRRRELELHDSCRCHIDCDLSFDRRHVCCCEQMCQRNFGRQLDHVFSDEQCRATEQQ